MNISAKSSRRTRAVESFKSAADCIGTVEHKMSLFAITRGQFSMIDAILACLQQIGTAEVSLWTWTVAEYEVQCLDRLRQDRQIAKATLIIDKGAQKKNAAIIQDWRNSFGRESVKYTLNHAKIATLQTEKFKLLLRGSMNLNFNPRFEQFDLTEGGADFELVKQIENDLPILGENATGADIYRTSKVSEAFSQEQLSIFQGVKVWAK